MSKGNTISKSRSYTYDSSNGLLSSRTMPGGKTVQYTYDAYGNTTGVNFESGTIAWSLTGYNGLRTTSDIVLDNYASPFKKTIVLDQYGYLDSLKITQALQYGVIAYQDEKYIFDPIRGNLMQRQGVYDVTSIRYSYDSTDRLLTATDTYNNQLMAVTYAANGNISSKTGIGSYTYGSTSHPHAVTEVDNTDGSIGHSYQEVFYNSWGKMYKVQQTDATGLYTYNVIYGPDLQRVESWLDRNQQTEYEKFYWDDYEEKTTGSLTTRYWYINGPDGLIGIYIEEQTPSGTVSMSTLAITDHLGSIEELCGNNNGHFYGARYDEWGNREKVFSYYLSDDIDRGFCGHEHIEELGLINMNGRMYDPLLGRFLSPDPFVQSPTNPQNYNRYSYCLINPLKYTDPSGEIVWAPIIIGAIIGTYSGGVLANDGNFDPTMWNWQSSKTWGYMAGGMLTGALSGAAIASSGIPMANTLSIMGGSLTNSLGTFAYTGGQTDITMSFGFASYNFTQSSWGWLGKKGNSILENIGYGFGALANIPDIISLIYGGGENISVNSASTNNRNSNGNKDWWGHSSITRENGESLVSVGPVEAVEKSDFLYETYIKSIKDADTSWPTHFNDKGTWSITLKNVSTKVIAGYAENIKRWDLLFNSCVGHATRSLWRAGVPTIYAFHPHMLNVQLLVRQIGIYSSSYLYKLPKD